MVLDTLGDLCPIPIVKITKAIKSIKTGETITLISDDPGIEVDLPAWCASFGHQIISITESDGVYRGIVKKMK